jgi:hypothetical protein
MFLKMQEAVGLKEKKSWKMKFTIWWIREWEKNPINSNIAHFSDLFYDFSYKLSDLADSCEVADIIISNHS